MSSCCSQGPVGPRPILAGLLISSLTVWVCGGEESTGPGGQQQPPSVASVAVTPSTATLVSLGETIQLAASALDASGNAVADKTFTWSSSDDSIATVSDAGLVTAVVDGPVTITATTAGVEGTAAIEIAQEAAQLRFIVLPTGAVAGLYIRPAVQVVLEDALGNVVAGATDTVTLALGANPSGGTLAGTSTQSAVNGVATFSNLSVDRVGAGYTLVARSAGLPDATSGVFGVVVLVFASVGVGGAESCGVTTHGAAYCWGARTAARRPVVVPGGHSFASLSVEDHICGVTTDGDAYCWGFASSGELGDGTEIEVRETPVAVSGGLTFTSVSAGENHTCGLTANGIAYCWGSNRSGQLGTEAELRPCERDSRWGCSATPVVVAGGLRFASLSAGLDHTCAVNQDGTVYCWGSNGHGQLGDGTTTDRSMPNMGVSGYTFASVSSGGNYTCGVTPSGTAYCWGRNFSGQLGDGTTIDQSRPVAVSGGLAFASVSAGRYYTCGVTTTGSAYCWGFNEYGQLGNGGTSYRATTTPVAVAGGLTFASVSARRNHTCGVTTDGVAYCWGWNVRGQLGNGRTDDSYIPVRVLGQP